MKSSKILGSTQTSLDKESDAYKISINSLVLAKCPSSIQELKELLESNGYYGRVSVKKVSVKSKKDLLVRVQVYLPDSKVNYIWPFIGSYNISKNCITKRKKPSAIIDNQKLYKCMDILLLADKRVEDLDSLPELFSKYIGWASKSEYSKMIRFLIKSELIVDGRFILRSLSDVKEVHDNLFDYTYFTVD